MNEREKWIYEHSEDNAYRYILGTKGDNPLICFGVNPSTACPEELDNTMRTVSTTAERLGYDSYIMLNLYPQRATNPDEMDKIMNKDAFFENLKYIENVLCRSNLKLWAAWGTLINKRPYLIKTLEKVEKMAEKYSCQWMILGQKSKDGHPHHPLYLAKTAEPEKFDVNQYIEEFTKSMIGKVVTVTVDRPMGTYHPEHETLYYPVNYGFVKGITAADGEEQDAYILGVYTPVRKFTGRIAAIIRRENDIEDKWVVIPENVCFTEEEIRWQVHFQEKFFKTEIIM